MPARPVRPAADDVTPCNLCGASNEVVVGTRDRDGHPLRTVLCRSCGLVWVNPRPTDAAMDAYYRTEYRSDYKGHTAPPLRKLVRGFLGAAARRSELVPLGARTMLDVGCGAGELVYLMRRAGVEASGLEPGVEFAGFARDVLRLPVQTSSVSTADVPSGSLDLVTMFHALEHVADPRRVLSTVRSWLRPGGHLLVEVPNVAARVQAPGHQYHYAHLYHFTGSTLAAIGEAVGLRSIQTTFSPDGGNVTCVFRHTGDGPRPAVGLEAEAARTLATLTTHSAVRHYLSTVPYRRAIGRLQRRLAEDRLLRRLNTVEDAVSWADTL